MSAERWARVEPGVVLDELNAALRPHNVRFAPDISTASRATIGGMMANNSCGARSVLYGKTIDHVLEQEVVLSDGSVVTFGPLDAAGLEAASAGSSLAAQCYRAVRGIAADRASEIERRFPKVVRRVGGYNLDEFIRPDRPFNLAKLMVGSEGTLGVVLNAKVNLVPLPNAKAVLAIQFNDLLESLAATPVILRHRPSAVEVMDKFILDHTRQSAVLDALRRSFIDGDPGSLLCVEFYGDRDEDLPPRMDAVERDLRAQGLGYRYHRVLDAAAQAQVWSLREAALGLSMAMKSDAKSLSFVEDTAVAPEKLRDYIERFQGIIQRHGTSAGVYAHASVGCLHVRPVVNMKTEAGVRLFEAIANDVSDLVLEFGGALSGEHGDGLVRSPFMRKMYGPTHLRRVLRGQERHSIPHGIFNPGKIVDAPPLTVEPALRRRLCHARIRRPISITRTTAAWRGPSTCAAGSAPAGRSSPARCVPRTWRRSTRSTRRAGGPTSCASPWPAGLARPAWATRASTRRSTCASSAARARRNARSAWMSPGSRASSWPTTGRATARRSRRGCSATCGASPRWAAGWRPLSNWLAGHGTRPPPQRTSARHRSPAHAAHVSADDARGRRCGCRRRLRGGDLQRHVHELLRAGDWDRRARRARGRRVSGPGSRATTAAAGRRSPRGCLRQAARLAARNTDALYPYAAAGRAIVFCEPSCLSAVREDAPALVRGETRTRAEAVARAAVLFEEFARTIVPRLTLSSGPASILLHGHCHQKSMGLVPAAKSLLSMIPGASVVDLDSGCCGMAGSWGYARDHYEMSRAIGERRLFPAVRGRQPGRRRRGRRHLLPPPDSRLHRASRRFTRRCCCVPCSTLNPFLRAAGNRRRNPQSSTAAVIHATTVACSTSVAVATSRSIS